MALIEVRNVHKKYSQGKLEVNALNGVTLSIEKGEFLAIAGPSGSGKTTLFNLIGGLDTITQGEIVLDGQTLNTMTQAELSTMRLHKIGFVFQTFNLIPVLSALENVEFILMLQGRNAKDRLELATEILTDVGLGDYLHRRPGEMSGGQQQRVAVARAIVAKPMLVLADEPTANLDSATGAALLELMRDLNQKYQTTFLFSTHDRMIMEKSKRLIMLRDGLIDEESARLFENRPL